MNPKERFLSVFDEDERLKLDRVPSFVQGVLSGFVQKYEDELFEDVDDEKLTFNLTFDPAIALGFDSVFAGIPNSIKLKPTYLKDEEGKEIKVGLSGQVPAKGSHFYNKGLLFNEENLNTLWSNIEVYDNSEAIKKTIEQYEEISDKIFPVVMIDGIFDRAWMGMQMAHFSRNYRKKTKLYRDVLRYFFELAKIKLEGLIEATGDRACVVCILDDVAFKGRLMIPPERWEEDIGPYFKELVKMIEDAGMIPLTHTDGNITELVPSYQKVGIRGLQGWEGGADPYYVAKNFPDFVVIGFGDVSEVIPFGTEEQIREHVKTLMDALKEGRHYIFGPSTVIQAEDPIDNVRTFMKYGYEFGKYT